MSTYTDIRYNYNLPSGYGGSLNLISEQTASSSASISFTSGIDSSYRTYIFKFINIHPSVDGAYLLYNLSSDGGSNYNVSKTSSCFHAYHDPADTYATMNYQPDGDGANSTGYLYFNWSTGNANDENQCGTFYLFNPSSTTYVKHFISCTNTTASDKGSFNFFNGGYANTTSAINAVDFKLSSGNIDAGTIKMYGIA